jgi:hypothetical protein
MTHTMNAELIVDRYLAVWSEPDAEVRRRAIAGLWAQDGVEFVEGAAFRGRKELEVRIAEAYEAFVGSGRYAVTSAGDVSGHDDIATFTIQLTTGGGEVAWAARVFIVLGENGLIQQDYQLTVKPLPAG